MILTNAPIQSRCQSSAGARLNPKCCLFNYLKIEFPGVSKVFLEECNPYCEILQCFVFLDLNANSEFAFNVVFVLKKICEIIE